MEKAVEKRGLKISHSKTEYLKTEEDLDEEARQQGEIVKKVEHFKYLGSVVSADDSCTEEVAKRIEAG